MRRLTLFPLLLAGAVLSGCVQGAPAPVVPPPAAPAAAPAVPRVAAPVLAAPAPVAVPAPPPLPAGPVDGRSGLHQASVISITGNADSRFTVLFRPAQTDAAKVEAAPAQLCRGAGRDLKDSRTNKPGAGSAMPGVQMMIVTCGA